MSASTETTKTEDISLAKTVAGLARQYFGGRRGLILLGATVVIAGMALNWSWFVAVGLAPIILAVAPCLAMCALGLCMNKMMGGKSCSTESKASTPEAKTDVSPAENSTAIVEEASARKGENNA